MTPEPEAVVVPAHADLKGAIHIVLKLVKAGRVEQPVRIMPDTDGDEPFTTTAAGALPVLLQGYRLALRKRMAALDRALRAARDATAADQGLLMAGRYLDPIMDDFRQAKADIVFLCEAAGHSFPEVGQMAVREFTAQVLALDRYVAEIVASVRMPATKGEVTGGGKLAVLQEKRLARDAFEVRLPAMGDVVEQLGGGRPLTKVLSEIMEESYGWLVKKFYPRIYENVGPYYSPKEMACHLANIVAETIRYGFARTPTAYRLLLPGLEYMAARKMPSFFLAPELAQAIQMTDFDDDINWTEMALPYEHGILMLPKGTIVHPTDGSVAMIVWSRVRAGEYPPPAAGIPTLTVPNTAFALVALCPEKAIWYDSTHSATFRSTLRLRNIFNLQPGEPSPAQIKHVPYLDQDLTAEDEAFLEKVGVMAFGTFLAMNARPGLVEPAKLLKRVGKAERAREFWSPNVIGARYRIKREVPTVNEAREFEFRRAQRAGEAAGGVGHASPRMHWRRGHYREQAYGERRALRKTIWIEPALIGALGGASA